MAKTVGDSWGNSGSIPRHTTDFLCALGKSLWFGVFNKRVTAQVCGENKHFKD